MCDGQMASGSGRLTALLCGCADGLRAVCSLAPPLHSLQRGRGLGAQVRKVRWRWVGETERRQEESGKLGRKGIRKKEWRVGCAAMKHKKTFKKGEEEQQ